MLCRLYRRIRPRKIGDRCAFEPSCSRYAEVSFRIFGLRKGAVLTLSRLRRCNAHHGGLDLPPGINEDPQKLEGTLNEV
ncbi:membrane protein insertion efficiency factor YidD [Pararhodobacter aggregans]